LNATVNDISVIPWWSALSVEETGVAGENHQPAANHWQTVSHNNVSSTPCHDPFKLTSSVLIATDCTCSCLFNYHTITTKEIKQ